MTEGMPPPPEETQQLHRRLTEKVLDRAASDPEWRQQLIDNPEAAIEAANFPETQQLQQLSAGAPEVEVVGQSGGGPGGCGWFWWWSPWWGWQQYWWTDWGGPGGGGPP